MTAATLLADLREVETIDICEDDGSIWKARAIPEPLHAFLVGRVAEGGAIAVSVRQAAEATILLRVRDPQSHQRREARRGAARTATCCAGREPRAMGGLTASD